MNAVNVALACSSDQVEWDAYVSTSDQTVPLNLFAWQAIIVNTFKADAPFFVAKDDTRGIVGILAGYVAKNLWGQRAFYSTRFGLLANNVKIATLLVDAAKRYCKNNNIETGEISSGFLNFSLPFRRTEKISVVLDLSGDRQEIWKQFRAKTRNSIRKGKKSGLILSRDKSYLPDFYEFYAIRMAMKNVTIYPLLFFENLFKSLGDNVELYIAMHDGKPVGGLIVVFAEKSAQYVYAGNLPGTESLCVTHFLLWEVIKVCVGRGIELFDMSESTKGGGVYRFKTLFGGVPRPVYYFKILEPVGEKSNPTSKIPDGWVNRTILMKILGRATVILNRTIQNLPLRFRRPCLVWKKKFEKLV